MVMDDLQRGQNPSSDAALVITAVACRGQSGWKGPLILYEYKPSLGDFVTLCDAVEVLIYCLRL